MSIKKRSYFLFILLLLQLFAIAQEEEILKIQKILTAKIDSCNNNLLELDDQQKRSIIKMADKVDGFAIVSDFFKQRNLLGEYYHVQMQKSIYQNNFDSIYYYFNKANNYYHKNYAENENLIVILRGYIIGWCANNNYVELATHLLKQSLEYYSTKKLNSTLWSYFVLSHIQRAAYNYEQAIQSGKIGLKQDNSVYLAIEMKADIAYLIAESFYILGDYQNSLAYGDTILSYTKNIPDEFRPDIGANFHNVAQMNTYTIKTIAYSSMLDFEQASLMLKQLDYFHSKIKVIGHMNNYGDELLAQRNWAHIIYHYNKGEYTQAMEFLNKNKKLTLTPALYPEYKDFDKWEARILEKMGKYEQANFALKKQIHFTDSISKSNTSKEVNSLWAMFEVDKAQLAKEKNDIKTNRFYIISISTGIVISIMVILIVYFVISNKKLREKNRVLFKQQTETDQLISQNSINKITSEVSEKDTETPQEKDIEQTLYLQIVEYLKATKKYTDPDISRESLAKEFGTNRQYIIDAISNNANMSFNVFINRLRIDYARDLLLNEKDILIKNVYTEAGFNNRKTFSLLFKERFGMSPSEFRACANEEIEKTIE